MLYVTQVPHEALNHGRVPRGQGAWHSRLALGIYLKRWRGRNESPISTFADDCHLMQRYPKRYPKQSVVHSQSTTL